MLDLKVRPIPISRLCTLCTYLSTFYKDDKTQFQSFVLKIATPPIVLFLFFSAEQSRDKTEFPVIKITNGIIYLKF